MTDGPDSMNRRRFLKVLGVTGAGAATLSACGIGPEPTENDCQPAVANERRRALGSISHPADGSDDRHGRPHSRLRLDDVKPRARIGELL